MESKEEIAKRIYDLTIKKTELRRKIFATTPTIVIQPEFKALMAIEKDIMDEALKLARLVLNEISINKAV